MLGICDQCCAKPSNFNHPEYDDSSQWVNTNECDTIVMSKQEPEVTDIVKNAVSVEDAELLSDEKNKVLVSYDNAVVDDANLEQDENISLKEDSVSSKFNGAANSLKELILAVRNELIVKAKAKTQKLKEMANSDAETMRDSKDINNLGRHVEALDAIFEDTLSRIRQSPYEDQEKLLTGYRTLLEEEKRVVVASLNMAKRLAPASIAYAEGNKSPAYQ